MDKQHWLQCFQKGKYDQCIDELMSSNFDSFCLGEVGRDVNVALCRYLQDQMNTHDSNGGEASGVAESLVYWRKSSKKFQAALKQIANKMKSRTPSLTWLPLELTVCYNVMHVAMATAHAPSEPSPHNSSISRLVGTVCDEESCLSPCLDRVLRAMRISNEVHHSASTLEKMEKLLKSGEVLHAFGSLVPLVLCGCLESLQLMQAGCLADALALLRLIQSSCGSDVLEVHPPLVRGLLPALEKELKSHLQSSPSPSPPSLQTPSLADLLSLLQALCCLRCYDNSAARQHLERVGFLQWQPACIFMQASLLLESGSGREAAALLEKLLHGSKVEPVEGALQARLSHLLAQCYVKLGLYQLSVHALQSALKADSAFLVPLYTLSRVYHLQKLDNAELEALNLLVTMLEDQERQGQQKATPVDDIFLEGILFRPIYSKDSISLLHAQYALAKRCFELERYQEASEQYVNILATLTGAVTLEVEKCDHIKLPSSSAIFAECGASLLASGELQDCLLVCRKALEAFADLSPLDLLASPTPSPSPPSSTPQGDTSWLTQAVEGVTPLSRKRSRPRDRGSISVGNLEEEDVDEATLLERQASLLVCRAQALQQLDRRAEAKQDVQKAMELLERCSDKSSSSGLSFQPSLKKPKVDPDQTDPSEGLAVPVPGWQRQLSRACCILAELLSAEEARREALRFHQLAVQYHPASTEAWYGCCRALQDLGRGREAAGAWLEHRGMDVSAPLEQERARLQQEVDTRGGTGGSGGGQAVFTEAAALRMDIASLECLQALS